MTEEEANTEKCCFTCANHRKTCFHGTLMNYTEEGCKRSGPPYYRAVEPKEKEE